MLQTKEKRSPTPSRSRRLRPVSYKLDWAREVVISLEALAAVTDPNLSHFSWITIGLLTANHIHIRIQQRNGRKTITTLQGVPKEYDQKKLLKAFKSEHKPAWSGHPLTIIALSWHLFLCCRRGVRLQRLAR